VKKILGIALLFAAALSAQSYTGFADVTNCSLIAGWAWGVYESQQLYMPHMECCRLRAIHRYSRWIPEPHQHTPPSGTQIHLIYRKKVPGNPRIVFS
jgi:hypothetical protein